MNSKEVYKTLFPDLSNTYGTSQGRTNIGIPNTQQSKKIYRRRVYLNKSGYDPGGAYWGKGSPLYVKFTLDKSYVRFFRK